jgi:hypothetical protein
MAERIPEEEQSNYETFRDCLSEPVLRTLAAPVKRVKTKRTPRRGRRNIDKKDAKDVKVLQMEEHGSAAEDLGEFIDVRYATFQTPPNYEKLINFAVPLKHHLPLPTTRSPHPHLHQISRLFSLASEILHLHFPVNFSISHQ